MRSQPRYLKLEGPPRAIVNKRFLRSGNPALVLNPSAPQTETRLTSAAFSFRIFGRRKQRRSCRHAVVGSGACQRSAATLKSSCRGRTCSRELVRRKECFD